MKSALNEIAKSILGRNLKPKDGMSIEAITSLEHSLAIELPNELKDFYLLVGELDIFMTSFQEFIEPYLKDDKLIFLQENQAVCYWAIDIKNLDNKTVWMSTNIESSAPEWYSENVNLYDFLKILMFYQSAQGGYPNGGAVYESNFTDRKEYLNFLEEVTHSYTKVVDHNGLVIYQQATKLIWYFTDREGNIEDIIFVSTRTYKDLKLLEQLGFSEL